MAALIGACFARDGELENHRVGKDQLLMKPLTLAVVGCIIGAFGCNNTSEGLKADADEAIATAVGKMRAAGDGLNDAKRGLDNDVKVFTSKTNSQLDTLAAKIDRLQREAVSAPANAKQALSEQAASLEARKKALEAKTNALGDRAGEEWSQAKTEVSDAVTSLGRDIDRALDELGDNVREATD
jgi:hypothetical protein